MRYQPKSENDVLADLVSAVVARTDLSDVTTTGSLYGVLRALASELGEAHMSVSLLVQLFGIFTARGTDLAQVARTIAPGLLAPGSARHSVGRVQFTRTAPLAPATEFLAPGTVCLSDTGLRFVTTAAAFASGFGLTTNEVSAVAAEPGEDSNIAAGAIRLIASGSSPFISATNTTPFTGGRSRESDDSFRTRLLNYVASLSRSTPEAFLGSILGATDLATGKVVQFVKVFEDPADRGNVIVYIDDGAGSAKELSTPVAGEIVTAAAAGGEEYLYLATGPICESEPLTVTSSIRGALTRGVDFWLNPASRLLWFTPPLVATEAITAGYTPYMNLVATVQKIIDGDPRDLENYPGLRAAGVVVRVQTPLVLTLPIAMRLTVDSSYDRVELRAQADDVTLRYVNSLGIGESFVLNELVQRVMEIAGVTDVAISAPTSNIAAQPFQIFRNTTNDVDVD